MTCKNCGFDIPENDRFCSNCGAEVKEEMPVNETPVNEAPQNLNGNNTAYGNYQEPQGANYGNQPGNGFYAGNPAQPPQGYWAPPVNDKAATLKDYLKWMLLFPLLNFIPGIGFIAFIVLCFKYALDSSFTARANYFKAVLIAQAVGLGLAIIAVIAMVAVVGTATAVGFSFLEEFDPSFFMDEFYYETFDFLSVAFMR